MGKKLKKIKSKKAMATAITQYVKMRVWERDKGKCVVCGSSYNVEPNAHFIPRSQGGMGIEENIVTLCNNFSENKCHYKFDFGGKELRETIGEKIETYLKSKYLGWSRDKVIYKKWNGNI